MLERLVMDRKLKPFMIWSVIQAGKMIKDPPQPASDQGRIFNQIFTNIINRYTLRKDKRMVEFYTAARNLFMQIYCTDSFYSSDFDEVFNVMQANKEFLNKFYS